MKEMNCRNVRREIEEAAPGELLSSSVKDHVMNCISCGTFSREQSRLQQIVSSLGTVEAPEDFDFRLRARLAREKPGSARPFSAWSLAGFSFGLPAAAVAAMLLLVGIAFVFATLKSHATRSLTAGGGPPAATAEPASSKVVEMAATPGATSKDGNQQAVANGTEKVASGSNPTPARRRNSRTEVATLKDRTTVATDFSSRGAQVLTSNNQAVGTYPTSAFPIDASYQSLKVSVNNGRGASRTISLPTVSFGSNQSLSQGGSLLMASSRVAW